MDEALGLIPMAVFVVLTSGRIVHANEAGRLCLERDARSVREGLAASVRHPAPTAPFRVSSLVARGAPGYWLAFEQSATPARTGFEPSVRQWGLSPRQTQVLGLLVKGYANKSIAADLQCSVSTVEQHVTAILRKASVSSRAELIVKANPPRT